MGKTRSVAPDDVDLGRDRTLVERAQAGDINAFSELYSRYFQRLVRFATRRVGDVHEAEEIAQEAFARAYRSLPDFAGERRFYPWMTVIASRLCVDSLRRRGRVEVGVVVDRETFESGFDRVEREGDLVTLGLALDRLTDRHREVLKLRETEGWSYQSIADHYQVPIGTVEALLWRARRALRREFMSLCSGLAALPLIRRFAFGSPSSRGSRVTTLGSVGAVVALGVSAYGGTLGATPAMAALAPASGAALISAVTWPAPARLPAASTPIAHLDPIHVAAPVQAAHGAKVPRVILTVTPMAGLGVEVTGSSPKQTAGMPLVVSPLGASGPIIGLRPGVGGSLIQIVEPGAR